MHEELLHYIWKYRKLPIEGLKTSDGQILKIHTPGRLNVHSGPDFFNAKIEIAGQLWAGNVEIHIRSSDWYQHGHQLDGAYNNVVLHVVWEDDVAVYRADQSPIPAMELKEFISSSLLRQYRLLFAAGKHKFINCETQLEGIDPSLISFWLERLFIERLEIKSDEIEDHLKATNNHWEQVLFMVLLKSFGLNVNGTAFLEIGQSIDISVIRKIGGNVLWLESLLYGSCGLLESPWPADSYLEALKSEYRYLKKRFSLSFQTRHRVEFARLRPSNFPTIRLSQFAAVYVKNPQLFSRLIAARTSTEIYSVFSVSASRYWDTHYTFGKVSGRNLKSLSRPFINLLLINTIIPIKFCFARFHGQNNTEEILKVLSTIPAEKNSVTNRFSELGILTSNAWMSQGVLQLYREYCVKNRCLHCALGCRILDGK